MKGETGQWTDTTQSRPSAPDIQGLRQNKALNINRYSTPLNVFMLLFLKIMQLLVEKTDVTTNIWTYAMEDALHFLI
jgi:hypothetical protein